VGFDNLFTPSLERFPELSFSLCSLSTTFLERTLILEEYPEQNTKFLDEQGIKFFQYGIPGNKVNALDTAKA